MRAREDPYTALNNTVGIHITQMMGLLYFLSLSFTAAQKYVTLSKRFLSTYMFENFHTTLKYRNNTIFQDTDIHFSHQSR